MILYCLPTHWTISSMLMCLFAAVYPILGIMPGHGRCWINICWVNVWVNKLLKALCLCNRTARGKIGLLIFIMHYIIRKIPVLFQEQICAQMKTIQTEITQQQHMFATLICFHLDIGMRRRVRGSVSQLLLQPAKGYLSLFCPGIMGQRKKQHSQKAQCSNPNTHPSRSHFYRPNQRCTFHFQNWRIKSSRAGKPLSFQVKQFLPGHHTHWHSHGTWYKQQAGQTKQVQQGLDRAWSQGLRERGSRKAPKRIWGELAHNWRSQVDQ